MPYYCFPSAGNWLYPNVLDALALYMAGVVVMSYFQNMTVNLLCNVIRKL